MDKDKLKIMMNRAQKGPISELNCCITCKLCKGYFIDATTIIECLHTFCRSCIVKYLESNKYCPICDVQVHKTKPLLNIRQDKTLQDLVYKLVPRLYHNEAKRRKLFYETTPLAKPTAFEENITTQYEYILAPDEVVNLTLSYNGCLSTRRYLRCPSAVSISHLVKLIQAKYELTDRHKVEIFYNSDVLVHNLSLMDVAYIYSWKKKEPLNLTFKIYECRAKKPKLDHVNNTLINNNINNWKEVQLRISENGEMSITGIQDALDLLDDTESNNFKSEIVINESKTTKEPAENHHNNNNNINNNNINKDQSDIKLQETTKPTPNTKLLNSGIKMVINNAKSGTTNSKKITTITTSNAIGTNSISMPKSIATLNINSELSVIPLNANISLSSCSTTTVFSTVNKTMCSTKSDDTSSNFKSVETNNFKRKNDDSENILLEVPAKLPKPTILNHTIGLMNLSNNHPLKKHAKMNRNGEKNVQKDSILPSKPIIINKSLFPTNKEQKILNNSLARNGDLISSKPTNSHPIITPAQLPHHQNLIKNHQQENNKFDEESHQNLATTSSSSSIKSKPSTPIGYKTLRDPPKSWNSQINSQIARVNQSVKAQQLANAAAAASQATSTGLYRGDLKNVRPAKFFKGRNVPRYLGNPASGVKPMYQVHVSPEKDKNPEQFVKSSVDNKSEIKKHSIVKIDPKTLKPVSEKAPETSNLSVTTSNASNLSNATNNPELRINSTTGDLKINTSSVSIFNPLKLQQQSSPKNERKSPKSPNSPKIKINSSNNSTSAVTTTTSSNSIVLSPKQQRDKTSLTFTPPNPFVPNLASPTLNPNQFLYPAGGFPSYDPRFMAACHSLWYSQRMAAAAAAGLVPPPLPHAFGLNMGLNPSSSPLSPGHSAKQQHSTQTKPSQNQSSSRASSNNSPVMRKSTSSPNNHSPNQVNKKGKEAAVKNEKSLEIALEKITQNKAKELSNSKNVRNGSPVQNIVQDDGKKSIENVCREQAKGEESKILAKKSENNSVEIQERTSTSDSEKMDSGATEPIKNDTKQEICKKIDEEIHKKPAENPIEPNQEANPDINKQEGITDNDKCDNNATTNTNSEEISENSLTNSSDKIEQSNVTSTGDTANESVSSAASEKVQDEAVNETFRSLKK